MGSSYSTIIVGGGIAGVATAYYLAQQGETGILLIEGDELASGSTGGSFGGVRQQFSTPEQVRLALRGHHFWSTFEETFGAPAGWAQEGYLFMTSSSERLELLGDAAAVQRACGAAEVEILDAHQVGDLLPWLGTDGLAGGCWTPGDGRCNPTDGVYALARLARRAGVEIRQHAPVRAIEMVGGAWHVRAGDLTVEAARVIVAAGFHTPKLVAPFGVDLEIGYTRRHIAITSPVLQDERFPLTIDLDTGLCMEREGAGAAIMVVTEDSEGHDTPDDMMMEFAELAEVRAPVFTDVSVVTTYTAFPDKNSGDGHPYIGEIEPGLWVIAGFDGHGTMHAPAYAEVLAGTLAGAPDPEVALAAYDPWRPSGERSEWLSARRKS